MSESKKKVGIFLPPALADALDEIAAERVSGKEKWQVISAAILAFLEMPKASQNDYINRIKTAGGTGTTVGELVDLAKRRHREASSQPRFVERAPDGSFGSPSAGSYVAGNLLYSRELKADEDVARDTGFAATGGKPDAPPMPPKRSKRRT